MDHASHQNPVDLPNLTKTTFNPLPTQDKPEKDAITCHVLDTTSGRPARGIDVTLTLLHPLGPSSPLKATTNEDGRVSRWNALDGPDLKSVIRNLQEHSDAAIVWELVFQTGKYFGPGKSFWPEVRLQFFSDAGDKNAHYHVPLLLGPWSYTTYRGS